MSRVSGLHSLSGCGWVVCVVCFGVGFGVFVGLSCGCFGFWYRLVVGVILWFPDVCGFVGVGII